MQQHKVNDEIWVLFLSYVICNKCRMVGVYMHVYSIMDSVEKVNNEFVQGYTNPKCQVQKEKHFDEILLFIIFKNYKFFIAFYISWKFSS